MITLTNGARPLLWQITPGGDGYRDYIGYVIATQLRGIHPYVVWHMSSDDGTDWDCASGDYCHTLEDAQEIFAKRARNLHIRVPEPMEVSNASID